MANIIYGWQCTSRYMYCIMLIFHCGYVLAILVITNPKIYKHFISSVMSKKKQKNLRVQLINYPFMVKLIKAPAYRLWCLWLLAFISWKVHFPFRTDCSVKSQCFFMVLQCPSPVHNSPPKYEWNYIYGYQYGKIVTLLWHPSTLYLLYKLTQIIFLEMLQCNLKRLDIVMLQRYGTMEIRHYTV